MVTVISAEKPAYRVLAVAGFFGPDDHLYQQGDMIYFEGEPNEEFEPLNDKAREIMASYLNKLDDLGRAVAEKLGRPFVGRPRDLDGAIQFATEVQRDNMAVMAAPKQVTTIEKITDDGVPETGEKRGRGRPRKQAPSLSIAV